MMDDFLYYFREMWVEKNVFCIIVNIGYYINQVN